jgi:hypothetical protein
MKENMFSDNQSGFRPNHSTESALHFYFYTFYFYTILGSIHKHTMPNGKW